MLAAIKRKDNGMRDAFFIFDSYRDRMRNGRKIMRENSIV